MPRSSSPARWLCRLLLLGAGLLAGAPAPAQVSARGPNRLVSVIDVSEHEDQVDLTMVFNCSMRFVSSLPASEGKEVRIQLGPLPDCGLSPLALVATETPPVLGGAGIVRSTRMEGIAPGQVTLTITFVKSEQFVIAQGADPHGLRVRLINHKRQKAQVFVGAQPAELTQYAINLDSEPKAYPQADIDLAHQRLKTPIYVSELTVNDEKWYRLRAGPIADRKEADRLLEQALRDYPRAWLAIGDDSVTTSGGATSAQPEKLPAVEKIGSDPPLQPEELKRLMAEARVALDKHDYKTAITVLTKLQRQPEFPERASAQELLGLARERAGELAHAKAEYEEYLRRYPNGEAAERVTLRLRTLRNAEARARTGREAPGEVHGWETSGDWSQLFRYDGQRITNGALPPNSTSTVPLGPLTQAENAVFNDFDLLARNRGNTFDFIGRLSAGYDKSFQSSASALGNPTRVSIASMELLDRPLGLLARLGRQVSVEDGILGTFDGVFLSWNFRPSWSLNAAAGYPVEQLILAPQTQERFETVALAYAPPGAHWDGNIFATTEKFQGYKDRQAVGFETRFLAQRASLVTVVDYDTFYHSLNTASLIGTVVLPDRWNVSFDAERRNSPVLTTRNALIGQPYTELSQLAFQLTLTPDQIYQLARDRTPVTDNYSITLNKPIGQRFQFTAIVTGTQTGATPASAGVAALSSTGLLLNYQMQLFANDLWRKGDFNVVTLTHGNTEIGRIDSASATSRFPIGGSWRLGPRFSVDRLTDASTGSTETTYIPSALLDWERGRWLFQLDTGAELGSREAFLQLPNGTFVQTQNTTRYYISISYRVTFQ
ncbi:MAG TPA: SPOR domain-containing protein [Steroidobacteraceae bacterium]|nr:SPOR domain-containing protein [Steroidobacteraceae bacterium]